MIIFLYVYFEFSRIGFQIFVSGCVVCAFNVLSEKKFIKKPSAL